MADNYIQYSVILELENDAQREWVREYLPLITEHLEDNELSLGRLLSQLEKEVSPGLLAEFRSVLLVGVPSDVELVDSGLWVHSEDSGDVLLCVLFLAIVMEKFGIEERLMLSWAETCSKPRINEFCGGLFVINCYGYAECNPSDQINQCHMRLDNIERDKKKS